MRPIVGQALFLSFFHLLHVRYISCILVCDINCAIQSNLEEILANQNGIKVVLSLASAEEKHLPPHARELLSPAERTVIVAVQQDEQEGEKRDTGDAAGDGRAGGCLADSVRSVFILRTSVVILSGRRWSWLLCA